MTDAHDEAMKALKGVSKTTIDSIEKQEQVEELLWHWYRTETKHGSLAMPSQRWKLAGRIMDLLQ